MITTRSAFLRSGRLAPLILTFACLPAGLAPGCSAAGGSGEERGGAGASAGGSGTGAATDGGFDAGLSGGGPGLDGGLDGSAAPACSFVDLLFVIDNSPSMGKYQDQLALAFPTFVDAMYEKLPVGIDLHVGVTTSDFFNGSCGESTVNCATAQTPDEVLAHYDPPTKLDNGVNGSQGRLFQWAGKRFFQANTSDANKQALKEWFAGAAVAAGETGCSYEMMSAGAGYAAHAANQAANSEGGQYFFRDKDGVLVVFVLSDEPDKSPEPTDTYKSMLVNVKTGCGGEKCILTAGLIDPCIEKVNNPLWVFLNAFGEPTIWGDLENYAGYTQVVGDALAQVVKQTCDEIATPK